VATKTVQVLTDDVDGTELTPGEGRTVYFSFEGDDYSIDLSDDNYRRFASEIEVWASKAFRPGAVVGRQRASARARTRARTGRSSAAPIPTVDMKDRRVWARDSGYPVSTRGRLPGAIHAAYAAVH
jgi:hypothetical protein